MHVADVRRCFVPIHDALSQRRNSFDLLRLFAAVAVVVQHATVHLNSNFFWVDPHDTYWFYDGVALFFVLSGALVYRSYDVLVSRGASARTFYRNRALRVIPAIWAYAIAVTIALLVAGVISVGDLGSKGFIAWAVSTFGLIPVYHPPLFSHFGVGVLNGSLWTIPAEVSFYVLVPFMHAMERRIGTMRFVALLAIVAGAGAVIDARYGAAGIPGKLFHVTCFPYFAYFAAGIAAFRLGDRVNRPWLLAVVSIVAYSLMAWVIIDSAFWDIGLPRLLKAAALAGIVLGLGTRDSRTAPILARADMSYGTYIWHMVIINFMIWYVARGGHLPGGTLNVIIAIVLSLGVAYLSWILVEQPALRKKVASSRVASPVPQTRAV
jgi:peptidoglycan/LPS O-acetylase OafA/YrhL